jgi:hypothetical protein
VRGAILLTLASSWYLVGLGLTVGLVIYPAFSIVGEQEWPKFHQQHSSRISWAVGPAWIAQAVGLVWWFFQGGQSSLWWWVSGVIAALAVALTALFAVPIHNEIASNKTEFLVKKLQRIHSLRTVVWVCGAVSVTFALR